MLVSASAEALVFASPDIEPTAAVPDDFPYWENVTQRRYQGPSVIYLGGGWALTARHVDYGEIALEGEMYSPLRGSRRTLLNENGSPADAMVFALDPEKPLPDLPRIPIAREPVRPGDQIVLIGFGKGRDKVTQWEEDGRSFFGFQWDEVGRKRWGTNRIASAGETMRQGSWTTRTIRFDFDEPLSAHTTRYEAQAAWGDSGGAVFVRRNQTWELVGMMISVSGNSSRPQETSTYGDRTFAADLTRYRSEIMRWTRAACSNELDDDGDGDVDHPADAGCLGPDDRDERDGNGPGLALTAFGVAAVVALSGLLFWSRRRAQRGSSTPISTSSSSAS